MFRERSNNSNGNSVDNQGRLVTCEHLTRRVTRTEIDGSITVVADKWNGKRLNSPNDLVVKSDDSIWFTDPAYGIDTDYEGDRQEPEIGACNVYRVDPQTGSVNAVITDMVRPNGIAFSPDEKYLYVADTGVTHRENGPKHIRRFKVNADGAGVSGGEVFATCTAGLFDGFRLDRDGPHLDQRRRRRACLRSRRDADRQGADPRAGRQRDVRRHEAQPALHLRHDFALFALRHRERMQTRMSAGQSLKGAVAIVTGGARGIGRATALALADMGAHIVIADLDEAAARETAGEIAARGGAAFAHATDIGERSLRRGDVRGGVRALRAASTFSSTMPASRSAGPPSIFRSPNGRR